MREPVDEICDSSRLNDCKTHGKVQPILPACSPSCSNHGFPWSIFVLEMVGTWRDQLNPWFLEEGMVESRKTGWSVKFKPVDVLGIFQPSVFSECLVKKLDFESEKNQWRKLLLDVSERCDEWDDCKEAIVKSSAKYQQLVGFSALAVTQKIPPNFKICVVMPKNSLSPLGVLTAASTVILVGGGT